MSIQKKSLFLHLKYKTKAKVRHFFEIDKKSSSRQTKCGRFSNSNDIISNHFRYFWDDGLNETFQMVSQLSLSFFIMTNLQSPLIASLDLELSLLQTFL